MMYRRRIFTTAEVGQARKMRLAGSTWRELGAAFNCDYATVRRVIEPGYSEFRAQQIRHRRARLGQTNAVNHIAEARAEVPAGVLVDRDRRVAAPRSVTATLCGDPAPGQSALDKRRGQSA